MTEGSTQGCVLQLECCHRWDASWRAGKTQLLLGKQPALTAACSPTSLKQPKEGRAGADKSQMKAKMRPRTPQRKGKMAVKVSRLIQGFSLIPFTKASTLMPQICPSCHYCIINNICLQFQNIFP